MTELTVDVRQLHAHAKELAKNQINYGPVESEPDACRFEQSFSDDGGKTWEVNWIAIDECVKTESDKAREFVPH